MKRLRFFCARIVFDHVMGAGHVAWALGEALAWVGMESFAVSVFNASARLYDRARAVMDAYYRWACPRRVPVPETGAGRRNGSAR